MQMDAGSHSTSWELSPVHLIAPGHVDAVLITPYRLPRLGCPRAHLAAATCLLSTPLAEAQGSQAGHPSQRSFEFWFMQPASVLSPVVGMPHFILRVS